jgi:hypothetical protein
MFNSPDMEEVTTFPFDVNENITLFRRGSVSRWGGTSSSSNDSLSITMKEGGLWGVGSDAESELAYVGRLAQYPEVIFIRSGTRWVGAVHESGRVLSSASRPWRPGE